MAIYDSSDKALGDYIVGQATGCAYNAYSSLGAQHRPSPAKSSVRSNSSRSSNSRRGSTSYATGTSSTIQQPARPLTKEERTRLKKQKSEQDAEELDNLFIGLIVLTTMGFVIYLNIQAAVNLPWYGHGLAVLVPAFVVYWTLKAAGWLTRIMRWTAQTLIACFLISLIVQLCS